MQPVEDLLQSVLFLIFFYCSSKLSITLSCSCFQVRLARQLCVLFSTLQLEEVACFSSNSSAGQACSDDSSAECCLVYGVCTFAQYLQFNMSYAKKKSSCYYLYQGDFRYYCQSSMAENWSQYFGISSLQSASSEIFSSGNQAAGNS